jgi:hypothetical protein
VFLQKTREEPAPPVLLDNGAPQETTVSALNDSPLTVPPAPQASRAPTEPHAVATGTTRAHVEPGPSDAGARADAGVTQPPTFTIQLPSNFPPLPSVLPPGFPTAFPTALPPGFELPGFKLPAPNPPRDAGAGSPAPKGGP